jgi:2-iminobutanoate/2-iminopropanoate deaminase
MSERRSIYIDGFDHGVAPVPAASRIGNMLWTSVISGYDKAASRHVEGAEAQAALMFKHLRAVIHAGGAKPSDIIRMTFFVRSNDVRPAINTEWVAMFPDPASRPARQIQTYETPKDALMQCDAVAILADVSR